jgi:alpha/beta superfamily hydrolase
MYPAGNLFIPASHGRLEAILKEPAGGDRRGAALVCHPHPLGGGTMHNKVVYRAAAGLSEAGLITLRFNFRGVGLSTGTHDEGVGEQDDVRTGLDYLTENYPHDEITFAGFSFGSRFGIETVLGDRRVSRLISIGTPVGKYDYAFLKKCAKPILFVHGDQDEFGTVENVKQLFDSLECEKQLVVFKDCGHFFDRHLNELKDAVRDWTIKEITES